jgi:hypothetical protein
MRRSFQRPSLDQVTVSQETCYESLEETSCRGRDWSIWMCLLPQVDELEPSRIRTKELLRAKRKHTWVLRHTAGCRENITRLAYLHCSNILASLSHVSINRRSAVCKAWFRRCMTGKGSQSPCMFVQFSDGKHIRALAIFVRGLSRVDTWEYRRSTAARVYVARICSWRDTVCHTRLR